MNAIFDVVSVFIYVYFLEKHVLTSNVDGSSRNPQIAIRPIRSIEILGPATYPVNQSFSF